MRFPYRADHVGSFLRPQDLLEARGNASISLERRKEIEDRHILRILAKQKELGFKIFTDGELRRRGFMSDFHEGVEGLDPTAEIARAWKGTATVGGRTSLTGIVYSKVRQKHSLTAHEVGFLKQHSPGDIKITLPTPNQFPAVAYKKGISEAAYSSYSEFLWDIVPIFQREIASLAVEGIQYIQIDAPRYSYYIDP